MKTYRRRVLDDLIGRRSQTAGAILVEGIKWCGKTTTCEQAAKSVIYLDEPEKRERRKEKRVMPMVMKHGGLITRNESDYRALYPTLNIFNPTSEASR